jgi:hypothetical protein
MRLPRSKYNSIDEIKSDINETTCVVLGNGSSINDLDWAKVDNFYTIGVNRIGKIYTPDIHVCVDSVCVTNQEYWCKDAPTKVSWHGYEDADFIRVGKKHPSLGFALYLAIDLGFTKIYLSGADYKGPHYNNGSYYYSRNGVYPPRPFRSGMRRIKKVQRLLTELGGELLNCSRDSAVDFLPHTEDINVPE